MTTDESLFHLERPARAKLWPLEPGDEMSWLQVQSNGTAIRMNGRIWSLAPALAGLGRSYWVLRDSDQNLTRVVMTSRRHRVARALNNGRLAEGAGSYMDKGEAYSHSDPRAKINQVRPPRAVAYHGAGRISGQPEGPVSEVIMMSWPKTLAKIDSGEIDYYALDLSTDFEPKIQREYDPDADE